LIGFFLSIKTLIFLVDGLFLVGLVFKNKG